MVLVQVESEACDFEQDNYWLFASISSQITGRAITKQQLELEEVAGVVRRCR